MLAKLAIEKADPTQTLSVPFYYGRKDAPSCYYGTTSRLPNAESSTTIQDVFVNKMQLSITDAVALIGGHTIGHVHPEISGFGATGTTGGPINAWDNTPDQFDNHYFGSLLAAWVNEHANGDLANTAPFTSSDTKNIWVHPPINGAVPPNIMLNADMALAYTISSANNGLGVLGQLCADNRSGCNNPTSTARPSTLSLVQSFANNNTVFLQAFATAFPHMTNVGYGIAGSSAGKLGTLTALNLATC